MSNRRIPLSEPVLGEEEGKILAECIDSGWISSVGPWVQLFETDFAMSVEVDQALAVSSGTAALHLALLACKIGPEDAVLVPTLTFISPVNTIRYVGATPIFLDCDAKLGLDTAKTEEFLHKECQLQGDWLIHRSTGKRIRAVIPVHVFGNLVDMEGLLEIAARYHLKVIEDATEALGSRFRSGRLAGKMAGTVGDFGCYSFNGNKIITTGGGGMLTCRAPADLAYCRYLSTQAKDDDLFFHHDEVGFNYRLTSIQAAVGIAQLEKLPGFIQRKRQIFRDYRKLLKNIGIGDLIEEPSYCESNYWLSCFQFRATRDLRQVIAEFKADQIEIRPVWRLSHLQKPYLNSPRGDLSNAMWIQPRLINLPSTPNLSSGELDRVYAVFRRL
jgi:perosamine synthetase